ALHAGLVTRWLFRWPRPQQAAPAGGCAEMDSDGRRRVAVIGTGHRGAGTWGRELLATCGPWVELVGLCDSNPLRLARAGAAIGTNAPQFTDLKTMLAVARPDTLIVCTPDFEHDEHIVTALAAGI